MEVDESNPTPVYFIMVLEGLLPTIFKFLAEIALSSSYSPSAKWIIESDTIRLLFKSLYGL